jgi:hypothetical protein
VDSFVEATEQYKEESAFSDELLEALEQTTPTVPFQLKDALDVIGNQTVNMEFASDYLGRVQVGIEALPEAIAKAVVNTLKSEQLQVDDTLIVTLESTSTDISWHQHHGSGWPNFVLDVRGVAPIPRDYEDHINDMLLQGKEAAWQWHWSGLLSKAMDEDDEDDEDDAYAEEELDEDIALEAWESSGEWEDSDERRAAIVDLLRADWTEAADATPKYNPLTGYGVENLHPTFQKVVALKDAVVAQIEDTLSTFGLQESSVSGDKAQVAGWRDDASPLTLRGGPEAIWESLSPYNDIWREHRLRLADYGLSAESDLTEVVALMDNPPPWIVEWQFQIEVKP